MANARTNDPETSHVAARRIPSREDADGLTLLQRRLLCIVADQYPFGVPVTDEDLIGLYAAKAHRNDWPRASDSSVRSRRHELSVRGYLSVADTVELPGGKRKMRRWIVTPTGIIASLHTIKGGAVR